MLKYRKYEILVSVMAFLTALIGLYSGLAIKLGPTDDKGHYTLIAFYILVCLAIIIISHFATKLSNFYIFRRSFGDQLFWYIPLLVFPFLTYFSKASQNLTVLIIGTAFTWGVITFTIAYDKVR